MLQSQRKASQAHNNPKNPHWENFKDARRAFGRELEKAKRNHWRDWLEKSSDPDLWTAHRYIMAPSGDGGKSRIPDLEQVTSKGTNRASNNEEKSAMLAKSFFPPPQAGNAQGTNSTGETKGEANMQSRPAHKGADQ